MDIPSISELSLKQLNHILLVKLPTLSDSEAAALKGKRARVIDKESLIELCKEYVSETEILGLLNESLSKPKTSSNPSQMEREAAELANCTPEQLLYRADCMRKHPEIVRASDPAMSGLSNDEIFAMADKMTSLAENPEMRSNMAQYLHSLSPDDFTNIRKQMGHGSGAPAPAGPSSQPQQFPSTGGVKLVDMTEAQLDEMVQAIIANPEYARNMLRSQSGLGHISSEQIDKQIQMLRGLDRDSMKATIKAVVQMQKLCQPLIGVYNKCESVTGGYAKYIFGIVFIVLCVLVAYVSWVGIHMLVTVLFKALNIYQDDASPQTPVDNSVESNEYHSTVPESAVGVGSKSNVLNDEFEF